MKSFFGFIKSRSNFDWFQLIVFDPTLQNRTQLNNTFHCHKHYRNILNKP